MQVILTANIKKLGNLGDTVTVRTGYALNYLLPQRKAIAATPENIEQFAAKRAEYEAHLLKLNQDTEIKANKIEQIAISLAFNASDDGHLYGSVTARHIVEFYAGYGILLAVSEVILPVQKIRQVGEYTIGFSLPGLERIVEQKLVVVAAK